MPKDAYALYDGATGAPADMGAVARLVAGSDFVAFGELHDQPGAGRFELELWKAVTGAPDKRPAALAMEFLERDTQADLDAYLAGSLEEAEFVKRARQSPGYAKMHRPLIEHAKAGGHPVVAANAPRRLVTAYRKQEAPYAEWKAALPEADQAFLPSTTATLEDAYRAKFVELMGPERGPAIFKAQSLWDDAMAEAVADHRAAHADARVLLIVGGFHVEGRLGTLTKYAQRRAQDRIGLITTVFAESATSLALPAEAKGTADLVLVVVKPPPEPKVHP